jgi:hypothetical protein
MTRIRVAAKASSPADALGGEWTTPVFPSDLRKLLKAYKVTLGLMTELQLKQTVADAAAKPFPVLR